MGLNKFSFHIQPLDSGLRSKILVENPVTVQELRRHFSGTSHLHNENPFSLNTSSLSSFNRLMHITSSRYHQYFI